ncbi:MAG: hypothetical protein KA734_01215 [Fluviicola sp.]|nr:hypothetical protein [Fluviicola sp.]MBP6272773.1 hypothetical protein [Fluviicola sp.]
MKDRLTVFFYMDKLQQYKYFKYTPLKRSNLRGIPQFNQDYIQPTTVKSYKVAIRNKIKYIVELYYYESIVFLKFHPKVFENHPNKYQLIGMNLRISEKRGLLNTCCKIILDEIDKSNDEKAVYCFFGQWYEKDNRLNRMHTKRFELYEKQATTFFSNQNFFHFKQSLINFYAISPIQNNKVSQQINQLFDEMTKKDEIIGQFMTERAKNEFL